MEQIKKNSLLEGTFRAFRYVAIYCSIAMFTVGISTAQTRAEPILIRFSHVVSDSSPKCVGVKRFQELVAQRLAGNVRVGIFAGASLYDDDRAEQSILFGDPEMAAPSISKLTSISRSLLVYDIASRFEGLAHLKRFRNSPAGQKLLSSMQARDQKQPNAELAASAR
jgi:C4-dicarboxylate-binding protein DctP